MPEKAERLGFAPVEGDCIISAVAEKPQAAFADRKRGADRWARLRKQN
jgi:hypothetical protein